MQGGLLNVRLRSARTVRLRSARTRPDTQIVLFVYYSGHADAEDLHLGESRLAVAEIAQLVRGSAADFRLLVP